MVQAEGPVPVQEFVFEKALLLFWKCFFQTYFFWGGQGIPLWLVAIYVAWTDFDPRGAEASPSLTSLGLSSGASFWPLNDEHPGAPGPPLDQAAAAERREEETDDGLGQADPELPVGNGEGEGERNAGSPSPPQQLHSGLEWQQRNPSGALPFDYSAPRLIALHPLPNVFAHFPPDFLYDFSYVYPFVYGTSAYVTPHFPYAAPYFAFSNPYTFHSATSSFPLFDPNRYVYSAPYNNPSFPNPDPHGDTWQLNWQRIHEEDTYYDETEDEECGGISEFNGLSFTGSVENFGPLGAGDLYEEFSFSGFSSSFLEDSETPSTSGLGSSARRCRDRSSEDEAAAKKPRWSNESDSD